MSNLERARWIVEPCNWRDKKHSQEPDEQRLIDAIAAALQAQRNEFAELERWAYAVIAHAEDGDWVAAQLAIHNMKANLDMKAAIRAGGTP